MISIDPGAHPGIALWNSRTSQLIHCGIDLDELVMWSLHNDKLVIEKPTIYPHSHSRPNDIVQLAISAGRLANAISAPHEHWVLPRQWKGQIPKTAKLADYIIYKRVVKALDELENMKLQSVLDKHPEDDNIVDSIAIGLWELKRL